MWIQLNEKIIFPDDRKLLFMIHPKAFGSSTATVLFVFSTAGFPARKSMEHRDNARHFDTSDAEAFDSCESKTFIFHNAPPFQTTTWFILTFFCNDAQKLKSTLSGESKGVDFKRHDNLCCPRKSFGLIQLSEVSYDAVQSCSTVVVRLNIVNCLYVP